MKAEFDKEIDALLRRRPWAGGRGAPAPREDAWATPHLDTDELSAFAEHALPEAARLAAVSHLADCDACRGAVITLSRAAGEPTKRAAVPVSVDPSEAVPAGGWLAALFSPHLLRFVAPALALCLVGAVAFVLLRTRRDGGSVAQHAPAVETGPLGSAPASETSANANGHTSAGPTDEATANVAVSPSTAQTSPPLQERRETPGSAPEPEAHDGPDERDVPSRRAPAEAAARADAPAPPPAATVAAEAVTVASAPSPQPAARDAANEKADESPKAAGEDVARNTEGPQQQERRAQLGNLDNVQQQSPDGSRNRSANNTFGGGARSAPAAPRREPERAGRSITGSRARSESRREEAESADDGAERTAAGHRFRREGHAWVDVNYRPSMAMTGVRRGTEAFRALVADIPELGRIAEQLPGEVITVVRGRAYRIR